MEQFEHLYEGNYSFSVGDIYSRSWDLLKENIGLFVGLGVIYLAINSALAFIPVIGNIASSIASGPLSIGFAIVARNLKNDSYTGIEDYFKGFEKTGQLFGASIIYGLALGVGLILFVIPGIYLGVALMFITYLVYFLDMPIFTAFEVSRKVVTKQWFSFLGFGIVSFLVVIAGALLLGVGLFVALPLVSIATFILFDDIFKIDNIDEHDHVMDQII